MAVYTDAMKWYNLGGLKAARLKYHFKVEFFSSQYPDLQAQGRLIFDSIKTIELPKYSIDTEVVNSWNVRQLVPTKVTFEPISISFNDTLDNRFQKFIARYLGIATGNFQPATKSIRTGLDNFGVKSLETSKDCPIDKIVITRFYGDLLDSRQFVPTQPQEPRLQNRSQVTLWRPKIIDVQHDTLDYSASEAVTWQVSLRYESVTYSGDGAELHGQNTGQSPVRDMAAGAAAAAEFNARAEQARAAGGPIDQAIGGGV